MTSYLEKLSGSKVPAISFAASSSENTASSSALQHTSSKTETANKVMHSLKALASQESLHHKPKFTFDHVVFPGSPQT